MWGVWGRALSHPRLPALWGGYWGPLPNGCGCGGWQVWGPVTNPTARALSSWLCALWGRHEAARGGRLLPGCGASGVGRSPTPDCPPSGRAAGAHYPLAVGAGGRGRGDPSPTPQRALLRGGFARFGGGIRVPAEGRLLPWCGASGVGRSPTPDCPPFGRAARLLCVCVPCLAGSGAPASWACFGAPHLSFGLSCFALCLFGPLRAGVALFVVVAGFFFCFLLLFPFSPSLRPRCVLLCVFSGPVCLGPWRLVPPPFFFIFFSLPPPSVRPVVSCFACFPAWGALGLGVLLPPPSSFFFFLPLPPPLPVVSGVYCFPVAVALCAALPPFFSSGLLLSSPAARLLCVFWGVVLCVPCPARSLCCARRLCCSWWLVLLVPGVAAFCWGSAGGSGCPALSFRGVYRLRCPCLVLPSLGVLPVVSCSPVLCPVALCRRVVLCCGSLSPFFFLFFPLLVALVSCCSPLVPGGFRFCALPVRCCAGVPAPLLSVRCSLALAGLAGVLCCCLLCLCVCCLAWLSFVVSCWVLVAPGVVSRWRAVVCPWVLCCALCRLACVALLCAVLFRFAPFDAAARCVVSWGAVLRLSVLCFLAPCFVLSPRAVCVLLWCVAAWCCSPLCFVPCAPWGVVLCVFCRLCPVRCRCVACSPSVPCFPVLCSVVLCCRVVPWCPVLPPCWICFLRGCGCTYLKNRCKIS